MSVEVHNSEQTESRPLNTELETLAPEATAELSPELNPTHATSEESEVSLASPSSPSSDTPSAETQSAASSSEPDYDAADFAAALANFDREQAAETAAAQSARPAPSARIPAPRPAR